MRRVLMFRLAFLAAAILACASCKREFRGYRVAPPAANATTMPRTSALTPGGPQPIEPVENQYEVNAYAMAEGKTLFSYYNCVGCHSHGGGGMGPPLMDNKWIYGSTPQQIHATIIQGRPNGMPSFGGKIPDDKIWEIVAYVRSLSGLVANDAAPGRDDHMHIKPAENSIQPTTPVVSGESPSQIQP